eukprot:scaffold99517_cov50-Phaeocystis_antarctica.AAC.1
MPMVAGRDERERRAPPPNLHRLFNSIHRNGHKGYALGSTYKVCESRVASRECGATCNCLTGSQSSVCENCFV